MVSAGGAAVFAEARGDLAQALIPHASGLAVAVREEPREEIRARIVGLSRTQLEGLVVVLAAMVDPERSLQDLLGWVDFDEYGEPLGSRPRSERTIRSAAAAVEPRVERAHGLDVLAVEQALDGHRVTLGPRERTAAVVQGILRGWGYERVAARLGMTYDAVQRSWERYKAAERAAGRPVPEVPVGEIGCAAA